MADAEVAELNENNFIFDVIESVNDHVHTVDSNYSEVQVGMENIGEDLCQVIPAIDDINHAEGGKLNLQLEDDSSKSHDGKSHDTIAILMDVSEPLETLRKLLETQLQRSLQQFEFWLQDTTKLEPSLSLVSQCVMGTWMVQVNVEVRYDEARLNITDVLQPPVDSQDSSELSQNMEESASVTQWIVAKEFYSQRKVELMPRDPEVWDCHHIRHWLRWAMNRFGFQVINRDLFPTNGADLIKLQYKEFTCYVPNDPGNIFWTHLQLLKKYKFVAVPKDPDITDTSQCSVSNKNRSQKPNCDRSTVITELWRSKSQSSFDIEGTHIQLWQFLLELLTDGAFRQVIQWVGDDGEFQLMDPEAVAQLWGLRKCKPMMNYEKLSRALRYYYDGDMIAKVAGKRFVYKFVCDMRTLLGYSAAELNQLLSQSINRTPSRLDIQPL